MDKSPFGGRSVIGQIRGDHLYARKRIWYRNSFQTRLSAKLIDRGSQTLVRCHFSMYPAVTVFMVIWLTAVVTIGGAIFIHSLMELTISRRSPGVWAGIAIPLVMVVFGIGLIHTGRHLARGEQPFLIEFVRNIAVARDHHLQSVGVPHLPETEDGQHHTVHTQSGSVPRRRLVTSSMAQLQSAIAERGFPIALICAALFVFWGFGYETVGRRLAIALNGVVVAKKEISRTWATHGTGMVYIVRTRNGTDRAYIAGGNDGSLPRNVPLGARIMKRKWQLSYLLNGKRVHDFPIIFYAVVLGAATVALMWGIFRLLRYRHEPD